MELKEEVLIAAPRDQVFAALNDPAVLKACIPGCEALEEDGEDAYTAQVVLKIGPVKARFSGRVALDLTAAPDGFSLAGEGSGGAAGFAKGGADVTLAEAEGGTLLSYEARAEIGGKLAQLGSRLVQGTAKKLAGKFFAAFADAMGGTQAA